MFFKIIKINLMFCFLNLYFNTAGAIIYIGREIVNDNIFDELRKTKDTKIFSIDEIIDFVYSLPQFYGLKKPIKDKDLYYSIECHCPFIIMYHKPMLYFSFRNRTP